MPDRHLHSFNQHPVLVNTRQHLRLGPIDLPIETKQLNVPQICILKRPSADAAHGTRCRAAHTDIAGTIIRTNWVQPTACLYDLDSGTLTEKTLPDRIPAEPLRFLARLNGCSRSLLVEDAREARWVVKLCHPTRGSNLLFNEAVGALLCELLHFPVPPSRPIWMPWSFFADSRVWFGKWDQTLPPQSGYHFSSRYLPDLCDTPFCESLPQRFDEDVSNQRDCFGMFLFDLWAMHGDSRQAFYVAHAGGYRAIFFDHGHLFGGPEWSLEQGTARIGTIERLALLNSHRSDWLEEWLSCFHEKLPSGLEKAIDITPAEWRRGDVTKLRVDLTTRLATLRPLFAHAVSRISERRISA